MAHPHQYLQDWYYVNAAMQAQLPYDLSQRQWLILCHIYLIDDVHTVKSLSFQFDIAKPAICRALDSLSQMGLIKRVRDAQDKRHVIMQKTLKGIGFLNQFSDIMEQYYIRAKQSASFAQ